MNTFLLSRKWFSFAYENPQAKPIHTSLYFWIIERANACGWKKIVDIQTEKSMECLGVTDWRTYKNGLQFLADNSFIEWVEKSKNQYTCNRISLVEQEEEIAESYSNAYAKNAKADAEAVAEAIVEAYAEADVKAIAEALQSYINNKTIKHKNNKTNRSPVGSVQSTPLTKAQLHAQEVQLQYQSLSPEDQETWDSFIKWYNKDELLANVRRMEQQPFPKQILSVVGEFGIDPVVDMLRNMGNWKKITSNLSVYLTLLTWLKRNTR
ncbi:hypothetical protein [Pontibacter pamirensis]|uniref:hypothetical protein n=1 Tax=Pontibacter pamirensis TaxID=2562824 RepID=UPI00138A155B|nr:hypothetical protein [Pontibacter pamirensis]